MSHNESFVYKSFAMNQTPNNAQWTWLLPFLNSFSIGLDLIFFLFQILRSEIMRITMPWCCCADAGHARLAAEKQPDHRESVDGGRIIDPFHPMSVIWRPTTWPQEQRHVSRSRFQISENLVLVVIEERWPSSSNFLKTVFVFCSSLLFVTCLLLRFDERSTRLIDIMFWNETVAAKVRNLHDYQLRLLNSSVSPPSGHDVANTLKYFSQMLLGNG